MLGYINVPVLAKYYVMESLSIEAGPQIGFLTNEKVEYTRTDTGKKIKSDAKYAKSVDFGLALGASYYITENLFASARYNFGLVNVQKSTGGNTKWHNNVLQISVGYRF